jgi:tetratricopeptide (TPR) repeat protein
MTKLTEVRPKFSANPHYREYERMLIELHHLFSEGKEDAPETDDLRDRMEVPGSWLSREEAERLGGLSADLYQLEGDELFLVVTDPGEANALLKRVQEAAARRDPKTVLQLLRRRPNAGDPGALAGLRGRLYYELGHPAAAAEFLWFALAHDPHNPRYRALLLYSLEDLQRHDEIIGAARGFRPACGEDLFWLVVYADALLRADSGDASAEVRQLMSDLGDVLTLAESEAGLASSALAYGYAVLAHLGLTIGDSTQAAEHLRLAEGKATGSPHERMLLTHVRSRLEQATSGGEAGVRGASSAYAPPARADSTGGVSGAILAWMTEREGELLRSVYESPPHPELVEAVPSP